MKKRPGFMVYLEWCSLMEDLTDQEFAALFRAMFDYCASGTPPRFDDRILRSLWHLVQPRLDEDEQRYQQIVQARQAAANRRWNKEPETPQRTDASPRTQAPPRKDFPQHTQPQRRTDPSPHADSSYRPDAMNKYLNW